MIIKKPCMFCGKPVDTKGKQQLSSWYGGCHTSCLNKWNHNHNVRRVM